MANKKSGKAPASNDAKARPIKTIHIFNPILFECELGEAWQMGFEAGRDDGSGSGHGPVFKLWDDNFPFTDTIAFIGKAFDKFILPKRLHVAAWTIGATLGLEQDCEQFEIFVVGCLAGIRAEQSRRR